MIFPDVLYWIFLQIRLKVFRILRRTFFLQKILAVKKKSATLRARLLLTIFFSKQKRLFLNKKILQLRKIYDITGGLVADGIFSLQKIFFITKKFSTLRALVTRSKFEFFAINHLSADWESRNQATITDKIFC